ncbi:MAG TPA: carbohydrate-binding family 9-like protein, partial [Bryobacteraceae bacterium]|nr:carbohydrate-binding family 9-like protein [Bryobacteraceae bacterium]
AGWREAQRSPRFVDMVTGEPGFFDTRAAALWDDENFYVGFWIDEPFVRARLTERDSLIFTENDVEVFIAGEDCYYEFEINALGTIYEVFFVWQDAFRRGSRFDVPEWDLLSRRVVTFAGDYDRNPESFWVGTHPRGPRWAYLDYDFPGLKSAIWIDGTLNDDSDIDRGWRVELAFPWTGMKALAGSRPLPPRPGDVWKMFFGRFEALRVCGKEVKPHPGWSWTPHGAYDSHLPEKFTEVEFSADTIG